MARSSSTAAVPFVLLASLALALAAQPAGAQTAPSRAFGSGMRYGVGYTAAVPEAVLGAGGFAFIGESRVGVFADFKLTVPSLTGDDVYCPPALTSCTVEFVTSERNDAELQTIDEWMLINGGGMYAITAELVVMAGAGMARKTRFREFFHDELDPSARITPTGGYYVDDDDGSGWEPQFVGGVMFRAGPRLAFRFGYETAPGGMSIGAYIVP